jgi:hypothetical protein
MASGPTAAATRRRLGGVPRPLLHLAIVCWVLGCGVACYWQVTVALAGDALGWLYSIEWPCFAIFGVVVWWNLCHDDPGARRVRSRPTFTGHKAPVVTRGADESPELAAYNDFLASLAGHDGEATGPS